MKIIEGGVCAAKGFVAGGIHAGIRKNKSKKDLSMIYSEAACAVAGVYTTNKVYGAPIRVTRAHIADGIARAIICNSGNANTCAPNGEEIAEKVCEMTAEALGISANDVVVASTGVIGEELNLEPFESGIPVLAKSLVADGSDAAAQGIMTTDTVKKEIAVEFEIGGCVCHIGGIAKGSGMIHPNMATMLAFITSDVAISSEILQAALDENIKDTFNQISVDGDTSTNDMCMVLANGAAGNAKIEGPGADFDAFKAGLLKVTGYLAKKLAEDGEGAGKLITCNVCGARTKDEARIISRSVISSSLLKAAIFGEDANWGRILCAIGYAPGDFSTENIDVNMGSVAGTICVCKGSRYFDHSEEEAAVILKEKEIIIDVDMNQGAESASAWGCDLTYDYVRINGDYRS